MTDLDRQTVPKLAAEEIRFINSQPGRIDVARFVLSRDGTHLLLRFRSSPLVDHGF
jgi:hypothetical protein